MAYETGSALDLGDLLSKLDTFLVANGWTQDRFEDGSVVASEGIAHWSKGTIAVGMKWIANNPNTVSLHQALAWSGSGLPGAQTDDSGNGHNSSFGSDTNLLNERCISQMGDGPFVSYHFFESDSSPTYVHVVVEVEPEVFRHFGWGEMDKFTDWTGGEYCYGHYQIQSTSAQPDNAGTSVLVDALFSATSTGTLRAATIHAEGLPHQGASEKWLHCGGGISAVTQQNNWRDTAGELKQLTQGGFRGGPVGYLLGPFESDVTTGHIPMYPITVFTRDFANDFSYLLGSLHDVRGIRIRHFTPGQEVTIGSDVWVLFPTARRTEDAIVNRTYYQGIAYKKVTT